MTPYVVAVYVNRVSLGRDEGTMMAYWSSVKTTWLVLEELLNVCKPIPGPIKVAPLELPIRPHVSPVPLVLSYVCSAHCVSLIAFPKFAALGEAYGDVHVMRMARLEACSQVSRRVMLLDMKRRRPMTMTARPRTGGQGKDCRLLSFVTLARIKHAFSHATMLPLWMRDMRRPSCEGDGLLLSFAALALSHIGASWKTCTVMTKETVLPTIVVRI